MDIRLGMGANLAADRLNEALLDSGMESLDSPTAARFSTYLDLLIRWNRQLNLTALRTPEEILRRHFVECIFCARSLPAGISTLLDYGSGGGFPGIPIAICRREIKVTLAESQQKKSVFLREVVRTLELSSTVYNGRGEMLPPSSFGAVTLRAVDGMGDAVQAADTLIDLEGWMILLIGESDADEYRRSFSGYNWCTPLRTPGSNHGVILMGQQGGG